MKIFKDNVEHLSKCYKELDELRKADYVAPMTSDGGKKKSAEYDFADAFLEPEKALRLMIEISQTREEIETGKRTPIITESKAQEIIQRNKKLFDNVHTMTVSPLYTSPRKLIIKPKSNKKV